MKRIHLLSAVVVFLLFASLWIYVQSDGFAGKIRPYVVAEVQRALGNDAQIGWVKANLLPLFVEVRDISIPAGRVRDAVAVRKIRLHLNPFPLLWKTVSFPSILVLEPRIAATRSADGSIDLVALAREVAGNLEKMRSGGPSSFTLRLGTITVRNGTVRFADEASRWVATVGRLALRARLDLSRARADVRMTNATLTVSAPSGTSYAADLKSAAAYERGAVSVSSFALQSPEGTIEASGTFSLDVNAPLQVRMTAHLGRQAPRSLGRLLKRKQQQQGPLVDAAITLRGTLADPELSGSSQLRGIDLAGVRVEEGSLRFAYGKGTGNVSGERWTLSRGEQRATIDAVELRTGFRDGKVDIIEATVRSGSTRAGASGWLSAGEGYHLALHAGFSGTPSVLKLFLSTDLSGTASLTGTVSGPLAAPEFDGTLSAGPLNIRGVPISSVSARWGYQGGVLSVTDADIRERSSVYRLEGAVSFPEQGPRFEARLRVVRSDVAGVVALFYQRIPLLLDASGELVFTGTTREFSGRGSLTLGPGTAYGESFRSGRVSAVLTSSRISFPEVVLEKPGASLTGTGWIGFDGTYATEIQGTGDDLAAVDHVRPASLSGPFSAEIRSSGRFSAPEVHAEVHADALRYREVMIGEGSCTARIADGTLTASGSIRSREGASVSAQGTLGLRGSHAWTFGMEVQGQDIDPFVYTPLSEHLGRGRLSVSGAVHLWGERIALDAVTGTLRLTTLALTLGDYRIENEGDIGLRVQSGSLAVTSLVLKGAGTRLSVTGSSGWGKDLEVTCNGEADLSLFRALTRTVEHADGAASVKLTIREDWTSPEIAGELVVRNGLLKIRDVPQRFAGLHGSIVFDQNRITSEGVSGEVGGGTITISGSAGIAGFTLTDFSTRTVIDNIIIRYPPGLTANLGGTLYYEGSPESQALTGEVIIKKARYERRVDWKSMLVDFSKKFLPQKKTELGWIGETQLNVRFSGKDNIQFENNLAKVPLDVDLLFRGTVNQVQLLGRVEARKGEVYFRKNVFRILYASVDFADPRRINPLLDVQAETKVREYQIRLGVSGTADRAVVTFLSDPPLSDSDILALLALGKKGEELKGKQSNVGSSEAISFATGAFQDFLETRARSLTGLDRFQVDPYINKYDTAVPRVTVGKEMVPDKLIMSYSSNIGGSTPEQNIRLEYILNRNVSLLGEYDELGQIGADVKFRFEFR
jgi:autotransporter translocation and assembly factor TamB